VWHLGKCELIDGSRGLNYLVGDLLELQREVASGKVGVQNCGKDLPNRSLFKGGGDEVRKVSREAERDLRGFGKTFA